MRKYSVKPGASKYQLIGDDGTLIVELMIKYDKKAKTCNIQHTKLGPEMTHLEYGALKAK